MPHRNQDYKLFSRRMSVFCFVLSKNHQTLDYSTAAGTELVLMTLSPMTTIPPLNYWSQLVTPHFVLVCLVIQQGAVWLSRALCPP